MIPRRVPRTTRARLARALPLLLVASLLARVAPAEPTGSYLHVSPFAGYALYPEHVRFTPTGEVEDHFALGGRIGFQIRRWIGLELAGDYVPTREVRETRTVAGVTTTQYDLDWMHGSLDLALTPFPGKRGGPFLLLGGGVLQMNRDIDESRVHQWNVEAGAGWQIWMSDVVGLRLEARELLFRSKDKPFATDKDWLGTTVLGGGLTFAIGATPRDTDHDGVPDPRDKCPGTPAGAHVDASGCPTDEDGDRVADGLDQCPDTPAGAVVDARGCPGDEAGDGVPDGLDHCVGTPKGATVDARGCPADGDGDGVFDGLDQCPDTPRGATVDARGCPTDSDHDGVADGLDQCPGTSPGLRVDAKGCPIEVTETETELLDTGMIRLEDVRFETGKAALRPEAFPSLDVVGQVLSKWPDLKIEIGGHTDSRGTTAYNQRLSEARVGAVLDYLLQKFPDLKREQYTLHGYGESKPLVANSSPLNMSKNRRVEFKVLNRDVLRREIQHRKLLENH